jgi:hypothetical protein
MTEQCSRLLLSFVGLLLISQLGCGSPTRVSAHRPPAMTPEPRTEESPPAAVTPPPGRVNGTATQETSRAQLKPEITFATTVCDFGEVSPGKKCVGKFEFTNTGNSLLRITEVKKCCGVVAELDREEFAPGQTGVLHVEYRSAGTADGIRRQLYVNSNDLAHPSVALTIKATIVPRVACEPKNLDVRVKGTDAGCPPITVTSLDGQPFSITSFRSSRDCLTAEFDPSVKATKFVLTPHVDFEKLQGVPAGVAVIGLTHPESGQASVYFRLVPDFKLRPQSLTVLNAEVRKPITREVYVESNYDEDFDVESVSSQSGLSRLVDKRKIGPRYQLEVELVPSAADDSGTFNDLLSVNLRDGRKLQLRVYARFASQPVAVRQPGQN